MNEGTLLYCPKCSTVEYTNYFGSITPNGDIIITRKFNRHSVIVAKEFTLICDCGYAIHYAEGKVRSGHQVTDYHYEKTI